MRLAEHTRRLLALARTLHRWAAALAALDPGHKERIAGYAETIAATLSRAADALARLEAVPGDVRARRDAQRELGRITGYVETLVDVLKHHLDGRKLAGVKRRLEQLASDGTPIDGAPAGYGRLVERLGAAEGYVRALADGLRA